MGKKWQIFMICCFLGSLFLPIGISKFEKGSLAGVSTEKLSDSSDGTGKEKMISAKGLISGDSQQKLESVILENYPGRSLMIRFRNQILYSVLKTPPNNNITIGKNRELFSYSAVGYYLQYKGLKTENDVKVLLDKTEKLERILKEHGIGLYLFITPSKQHYYEDDLPNVTRFLAPERKKSNYEMLKEQLKGRNLKCFDGIQYIDGHKNEFDERVPLFYKTGTHWSNYAGYKTAAAFGEWLSKESGYRLPKAEVRAVPIEKPDYPDADLFDTFNVFEPPYDTYYRADMNIIDPATDAPGFFCRGCSFMGQSLSALIQNDYFGKDVHMENTQIFTKKFTENTQFSGYEETDLTGLLTDIDIMVLEMNEASPLSLGLGIIDYLLEHPEVLPDKEGKE